MPPSLAPLPKAAPQITEVIANTLRAEILQGLLKSNLPLRQDEIAERFGVSKIPVREALYQLKAEGLVTFFPNRGAVVAALSSAEVDEIYAMRIALETLALRRAIPHLTIANLTQAEALLDAIDQEKAVAQWGELNWEFHALLYQPANLPRLMEWVRILHINVARYLVIFLVGLEYQATSQREHRAILEACRQGQTDIAVTLLEEHLQAAANKLVAFLQQRAS
ncbi:MAG: GntR family transcriptional regulator [Chloroflexi bacterium]|nr:GntR family transcriptional regulator [Chloroflexota bacterium]